MDYNLVYIENEHYTIKISHRSEGHYGCFYRIVDKNTYKMVEASQRKIVLRLVRAFELYLDHDDERLRSKIKYDLIEIAEKMKVPRSYLEKITRAGEW